jgi:lysine-ketoglutarate reductase/saccharopine dehydrogenase-like protein (TIGR00300 family)
MTNTQENNHILMCRPDFFDVKYIINPWMEGNIARANSDVSKAQWDRLYAIISSLAKVSLVPPDPRVPDLVFTANAGLVFDSTCIISRFFHQERMPEEPVFESWFTQNGFTCKLLPENIPFEGAGDALFDRGANILWAGYGFRTELEAHSYLSQWVPSEVLSLRLVDARFYHLDTCFCPLEGGYVMYYPPAFDEYSNRLIELRIPKDRRIPVSEKDAVLFACNAVNIESHIIMNEVSDELTSQLQSIGFTTHQTPLGEFLKSGGAAKCLTIRLNEPMGKTSVTSGKLESQLIEFEGHIIDTGTLGSALDCIVNGGGSFHVQNFHLGEQRQSASKAEIRILAPSKDIINRILPQLIKLGGTLPLNEIRNVQLGTTTQDGVAPEEFYITSIYPTEIRFRDSWLRVKNQRMNCVITVHDSDTSEPSATCCLLRDLKKGDSVVVGAHGVRTIHKVKAREPRHLNDYSFMGSTSSSERRVELLVEQLAWEFRQIRDRGGKITIAAGPVVIHTGAAEHLSYLIREGYVSALLGGNGLAIHDIELAMMGTSLGVDLTQGIPVQDGQQNHIKALNQVRKHGSIHNSVSNGVLRSGIMYECVTHKVPYCIAASIRDDQPLPDTELDTARAQEKFARLLHGSDLILLLSSMHHGDAVSNMTPAGVRLVFVDTNPMAHSMIEGRRGAGELIEIITDVGLFLSHLAGKLTSLKMPHLEE